MLIDSPPARARRDGMNKKLLALKKQSVDLRREIEKEERIEWNRRGPRLVGKCYGHVCRNDPEHWDSHEEIYYKILACRKDIGRSVVVAAKVEIIPGLPLIKTGSVEFINADFLDLFDEIPLVEWDEALSRARMMVSSIIGEEAPHE